MTTISFRETLGQSAAQVGFDLRLPPHGAIQYFQRKTKFTVPSLSDPWHRVWQHEHG